MSGSNPNPWRDCTNEQSIHTTCTIPATQLPNALRALADRLHANPHLILHALYDSGGPDFTDDDQPAVTLTAHLASATPNRTYWLGPPLLMYPDEQLDTEDHTAP